MRCGVAVLTAAIGCGKKASPTTGGSVQNAPAGEVPAPREVVAEPKQILKSPDNSPPIPVDTLKLINEYKDREIAADAKYRGKLVETKVDVRKTGRTESGEPYIGSVYGSDRPDPPIIYHVFPKDREAEVAALKLGEVVTIVGTCAGRVNDGKSRMVRGLEFHIRVDDCKVTK